jgi:DNA gyrase/topoisomerase IV subunit A
VIRIPVEEFKRLGRSTQGVIVMRLRGDEKVSTLAPVVESEEAVASDTGVDELEPAPPAAE